MEKFTVLYPIWHTGEKRDYAPGEEVTLDHLPEEAVKMLVERKVVIPAESFELPKLKGMTKAHVSTLLLLGVQSLADMKEKGISFLARTLPGVPASTLASWLSQGEKAPAVASPEAKPKG